MTTDPHKNYSSDWQTPPEWVQWASETMGGIDLDPCGHSTAPSSKVAGHYFDGIAYDGLASKWKGRVYVNPPGSNSNKSVREWWSHAMMQIDQLDALVWCFFNYEAVFGMEPSPLDLPGWMVMPQRRVGFFRDGKRIRSARNRTWFWTTKPPAPPPCDVSWVVGTGDTNIAQLVHYEATADVAARQQFN